MARKAPATEAAITERIPLASLRPHPRNYQKHPPEQIKKLAASLKRFGQKKNIVTWDRGDFQYVIAGHGLLEAAQTINFPALDANVFPIDTPEDEIIGYMVADNETARWAEPDLAQLEALLQEQLDAGYPLESVGFTLDELEALTQQLEEETASQGRRAIDDPGGGGDDFDTSQAETRCKAGDLWQLGRHRLLCGDSTKEEEVARLMQGETPFIMVTDPPYGVDYDPAWRNEAAEAGHLAYAARRISPVANDTRIDWADAWLLFAGDVVYCWHAGRHASIVQTSLESAGFETRCQIIWAKSNFPISRGHYHWRHEPCWYLVRKGATARWCGDHKQTTLWEINLDKNVEGGHSTQKPLECMARPIRNHGEEDDVVYDPFLGSGTTLIACERLGRRCYGLEIEPRYCDVILARWEAETGEKAVRM